MNWGKFHLLPKVARNGSLTILRAIFKPKELLGLPAFEDIAIAGNSTLPNLAPRSRN
ncbi:MAG: hypothetical protein PUP93_15175 [Rhizonema sp. NSF051]|nr:hypothetical protein [Rhizonema sp. NSF051]